MPTSMLPDRECWFPIGFTVGMPDVQLYMQQDACDLSPEAMMRESIGIDQDRILGYRGTLYRRSALTSVVELARML